jgi:cytoskeletal protein CcmA (bactofilin family)
MWRKQQEEPKANPSQAKPDTAAPQAVATLPKPDVQPVPAAAAAVSPAPVAATPAPSQATRAPSPSFPSAARSGEAGHLTKSLVIKGEITGREDLFIDGEVQGKIRIEEGVVTVGPSGRVNAEIVAREIVIQGNVKGNLTGRDRVQIAHSGRANGNVITRRISIDDGAELRGNVEITPAEEARGARPKSEASQPVKTIA